MPKKNESLLSLPKVPHGLAIEVGVNRSAQANGFLVIADKRRFVDDSARQLATQKVFKMKAAYGMANMAEVDRLAMSTFYETLSSISRVQEQALGTDDQGYIDEFAHHMKQVSAQHMWAAVEIACPAIAEQIASLPYSLAPEERRGFLSRLLSG